MHRIGTAIDLICYNAANGHLVIVELKTGFMMDRAEPARLNGCKCTMKQSLHSVPDSLLNRHLAQLALTRLLFINEKQTMLSLKKLTVAGVDGLLLYIDDQKSTAYPLPIWWKEMAPTILDQCL